MDEMRQMRTTEPALTGERAKEKGMRKNRVSQIISFKKDPLEKIDAPKLKMRNKQNSKLKITQISLNENKMMGSEEKDEGEKVKKSFFSAKNEGSAKLGNKTDQEQIIRTNRPWPIDQVFNYFQVHINILENKDTCFWIGLTTISESKKKYQIPGSAKDSIGLKISANSDQIQIHHNESKILDSEEDEVLEKSRAIVDGDCFGCGFYPYKNIVFFTLNGEKFTPNIKFGSNHEEKKFQVYQPHINRYYPTISFTSMYIIDIDIIFENGWEQFRFDYQSKFMQSAQRFQRSEILDHSSPCALKRTVKNEASLTIESDEYNLVRNYLRFHGFNQTAEKVEVEMKNKNIKHNCVNRAIKHREKYNKRFNKELKEFERQGKEKKIKKEDRKKKKNKGRQFSFDKKSDSEQMSNSNHDSSESSISNESEEYSYEDFLRRGDSLPRQLRKSRKKIEESEKNQSNALKKIGKQAREERERLKKFNQKIDRIKKRQELLYNKERIDVIRNLRNGKLDIAWKILEKDFPRILEEQIYLKTFFKAMKFMKVYMENGKTFAMKLMREEECEFQMFENCLFPFYKKERQREFCDFRPLKEVLFLFCDDYRQGFSLEKQMDIFSQIISQIICEKMGFVGASDLEIMFEHFRKIKEKIEEAGVPSGGLNLL